MENKDDLISRKEALDDISKMHGVMYPDHNLKYISQDVVLSRIRGLSSRMTAAEAWDTARKICCEPEDGGLLYKNITDIFSNVGSGSILNLLTPEEAKAKIEAWENRLKVGDAVEHMATHEKAIITAVGLDGVTYNILFRDGDTGAYYATELRKTGKTIDIQSVLDQLEE